ncbi:MAG: hypothetical protein EZS28_055704, partial [Streblomastix strix]
QIAQEPQTLLKLLSETEKLNDSEYKDKKSIKDSKKINRRSLNRSLHRSRSQSSLSNKKRSVGRSRERSFDREREYNEYNSSGYANRSGGIRSDWKKKQGKQEKGNQSDVRKHDGEYN